MPLLSRLRSTHEVHRKTFTPGRLNQPLRKRLNVALIQAALVGNDRFLSFSEFPSPGRSLDARVTCRHISVTVHLESDSLLGEDGKSGLLR